MKKFLALSLLLMLTVGAPAYAQEVKPGFQFTTAFHCSYEGYLPQAEALERRDDRGAVNALTVALSTGECVNLDNREGMEVVEVLDDYSWVTNFQKDVLGVKVVLTKTNEVRYTFYVQGV